MEEKLSCNISMHEEEMDGKKVFVVDCAELGVSDFGDTIEEALDNLKKGINENIFYNNCNRLCIRATPLWSFI